MTQRLTHHPTRDCQFKGDVDENPYPRPGSNIARERGCLCDPSANHFGAGMRCGPNCLNRIWVTKEGCPLHWKREP